MKHLILLAALALIVAACSNDGDTTPASDASEPDTCPVAQPTAETSCTVQTPTSCDYKISSCPCGPTDLFWHCECQGGKWSCSRDYDCYPCGDSGADGRTLFGE